MRVFLWIIAALLAATPATARDICQISNMLPPAEYDHDPPADVVVKVYHMPLDMLLFMCTSPINPVPIETLNGCASKESDDFWVVRIRDDLSPEEEACILRHERAHVNGWTHSRRAMVPEAGIRFPGL
jgi:hypothetical protein